MNAHYQRGCILYDTGRHELAEKEFRLALADDPEDVAAHCLLSLNYTALKRPDEALQAARDAVGLAPETDLCYHALARAHLAAEQLPAAREAAQEAIRLDPDDVDHYALLAWIALQQKEPATALEAARTGLEIDPGHEDCGRHQSLALLALNRPAEAAEAAEGTLRQNPDSSYSHTTHAYACLHRGEVKQALHHFREALRIDPENAGARGGMLEAMKARNPLYRLILAHMLWASRLSSKLQWTLILVLWLGGRIVDYLGSLHPVLGAIASPLLVVYVLFIFSMWVALPVGDFELLLSPYGRWGLTRQRLWAAMLVGPCALATIVVAGVCLVTGQGIWELTALYLGATSMVLTGLLLIAARSRPWWLTALGAATLGLLLASGVLAWTYPEMWLRISDATLLAFIAFQLATNYCAIHK